MNPNSHIWTSTDFGLDDIGSPSAPPVGRIEYSQEYVIPRITTDELRRVYEEERQRVWKAAEEAVKAHNDMHLNTVENLTDQIVALRLRVAELEQELSGLYTEALHES